MTLTTGRQQQQKKRKDIQTEWTGTTNMITFMYKCWSMNGWNRTNVNRLSDSFRGKEKLVYKEHSYQWGLFIA